MLAISKKWIFIPVEVKARELSSKLLLATAAVKSGFGVFLGRNGMNISREKFPKGIYFEKCLSTHKKDMHRLQVQKLGNQLVSLDEEGLLFVSDEIYLKKRISQESIDLSSLIFCWGEVQAQLIRDKFVTQDKVITTGGPRLDLWRPEFRFIHQQEESEIKKNLKEFVLVVSNWGLNNTEKQSGVDPDLPRERDFSESFVKSFRPSIRNAFIQLIFRLAKEFPRKTFVVRPHPVDIQDYWDKKAAEFPANVRVVSRGAISPWINVAKAVIHNNCTTGIEAWVSGKKVISYSPQFDGFERSNLYTMPVNNLGRICRNQEEVITALRSEEPVSNFVDELECSQVASKFLSINRDKLSSERIINALKLLNVSEEVYKISEYRGLKKCRSFSAEIRWRIRDALGLSGMYTWQYTQKKNPGLRFEEVNDMIEKFAIYFGDNPCHYKVRQVDKDTFCIFGKELSPIVS